jgi:hypothetical protein
LAPYRHDKLFIDSVHILFSWVKKGTRLVPLSTKYYEKESSKRILTLENLLMIRPMGVVSKKDCGAFRMESSIFVKNYVQIPRVRQAMTNTDTGERKQTETALTFCEARRAMNVVTTIDAKTTTTYTTLMRA